MQKLNGVESVEMSLERASATIRLRPGNRVSLPALRQIVKDNGFRATEATVTGVGTVVDRDGRPAFQLNGTDAVWLLVSPGATRNIRGYLDAVELAKTRPSGLVEAVGTIAPPAGPDQPEVFAVQSLSPAK
jgi:hypothetical protein